MEKPTKSELERRIGSDILHYKGDLPERVAIAWSGYIAALLEWGLLSVGEHDALHALLPAVGNDPVYDIMLGRNDEAP